MLKNAITDNDIMNCFDTMVELRPHLNRDTFLTTVRDIAKGGYQLAYIQKKQRLWQ